MVYTYFAIQQHLNAVCSAPPHPSSPQRAVDLSSQTVSLFGAVSKTKVIVLPLLPLRSKSLVPLFLPNPLPLIHLSVIPNQKSRDGGDSTLMIASRSWAL